MQGSQNDNQFKTGFENPQLEKTILTLLREIMSHYSIQECHTLLQLQLQRQVVLYCNYKYIHSNLYRLHQIIYFYRTILLKKCNQEHRSQIVFSSLQNDWALQSVVLWRLRAHTYIMQAYAKKTRSSRVAGFCDSRYGCMRPVILIKKFSYHVHISLFITLC